MSRSNGRPEAYVDNYPALKAWLEKWEARCMWQLPQGQNFVEGWLFPGGRICVLQIYHGGTGWEIYTPDGGGGVEAAFADAEKRMELVGR